MRFLLSLTLSLALAVGYCQSMQAEYLEAKRQLSLGNYSTAKFAFQNLSQDNTFGAYASFYYALSAYKNDELKLAYDMWRQVQINYPTWDQNREVNYWLAKTAFELKRFTEGFRYLEGLSQDTKQLVIQQTLDSLNYEELKKAYELNPESEELASILVSSIQEMPYSERDKDFLGQLSEKFDFEIVSEGVNLPEIKKDKYSIAVVLPFMFESLENPQPVLQNSIIWNLYLGMEKAQKDLKKKNIDIELFPFDTKKSGDATSRLTRNRNFEKADVIVGPLYSEPNGVISNYSADKKISMINPLSSNSEIIGDNPFSYLFKPSYETQGKVAAKYASQNFTGNRKAFVFYETLRDSLVARSYQEEIEKDSFFVVRFEQMTNESAQQVQKDFTQKYEVRLDNKHTMEEIDSIGLIPGRIVKYRSLRGKNSGKLILDEEGNPITEYYEERFRVKEDSIGHIFVATSSNLLANNFISLAEVRNDTIGVIGYRSWLEFPTISYNQLERLGIAFISPSLFNKSNEFYEELEQSFIETAGREPGEYHLIGYELIYQLGYLLKKHGKYFQKGLSSGEKIDGKIMYGLSYGAYHDNQVVPITKLEDLKLVNQEYKTEEVESEKN